MTTNPIKWRIREWFPSFDERTQERLRIYHLELLRWNRKINLISASSAPDADLLHFADSIFGGQLVLKDMGAAGEIWDIGSGNGMPGAIIGILKPSLGILCLDADERKIAFIKQLSLRLELDNLAARCERIEKIPSEAIHCAVMRGFAPIEKALTQCQKQLSASGKIYHFKGPDWGDEVRTVPQALAKFWKSTLIGEYKLKDDTEGKAPASRAIVKSTKL